MALNITNPLSIRLGVVGGGVMGSGIALAALQAGMLVSLYDLDSAMLERARAYATSHLERKNLAVRLNNLNLTSNLQDLRGAGVVIEAIPEDLALKEELFARLDAICPPPAILATNTSTLAVTAIAAATQTPERVAGMHFFNPAPVLPLVEIIRGARTAPETTTALTALARILGKTPVDVADTPGFIVNRVARPFYGEALRLLGEGAATHAEIDRLVRLSGGFRMGPFQLMDLIGIDINYKAMHSMWEQTFGEPRYRPHAIQVQMVQQKALGQKTGRGFYTYLEPGGKSTAPDEPAAPRLRPHTGTIVYVNGEWGPGVLDLCLQGGYTLEPAQDWEGGDAVAALVLAGREADLQPRLQALERRLAPGVPLICQCVDTTLLEIATWLEHPERLVGFDSLFLANGPAITLVSGPRPAPIMRQQAEAIFSGLGKLPVWVQDTPGLVLPRIVAMLANEAAFAAGESVAAPDVIDQAMQLGVNYPRGPLAWGAALGWGRIVAILNHLHQEYGEDRYRAAPWLRRQARMAKLA